ncbi:MAG: hypothetical protein Tsb009_13310 [Planctomycetaceae bacterium]
MIHTSFYRWFTALLLILSLTGCASSGSGLFNSSNMLTAFKFGGSGVPAGQREPKVEYVEAEPENIFGEQQDFGE